MNRSGWNQEMIVLLSRKFVYVSFRTKRGSAVLCEPQVAGHCLAINSFFQFSRRLRGYVQAIHMIGGILLIIVGVLLITDYMTLLNAYVLRFTPHWLLQRL